MRPSYAVTRLQGRYHPSYAPVLGIARLARNTDRRELARMQFYAIEVRCIPVPHTHTHILNAQFVGTDVTQQTRSQGQGTRVGQGGGAHGVRKGHPCLSVRPYSRLLSLSLHWRSQFFCFGMTT